MPSRHVRLEGSMKLGLGSRLVETFWVFYSYSNIRETLWSSELDYSLTRQPVDWVSPTSAQKG